jgi:pseudaminic acid biosynthesis-associated methylase
MNDQARYWQENNEYHQRSPGDEEASYHMLRKALACADLRWNSSVLELGCGTGTNLRAIKRIITSPQMTGVDINPDALAKIPEDARMVRASITEWLPDDAWDLVFTRGVLIHIPENRLQAAYRTIMQAANRYVLICEYFSPQRRMIKYRGQDDRLWADDFAGMLIDGYDLKLVDYGFIYDRDLYPQDNITFFLMEKP